MAHEWLPGFVASALVVLIAAACLEGAASPQPESCLDAGRESPRADGGTASGPTERVLRIEHGDNLTARHLAELQRRSATGQDLLRRIERLRLTVLIIRAYPLMVNTTGLYGRGLFW